MERKWMRGRRSENPRVIHTGKAAESDPERAVWCSFSSFGLYNLPYLTANTSHCISPLSVDSTLRLSSHFSSPKPSGKHLSGCPTCEAEALRLCYRIGVVPTGIEACDWPRDVLDLCWLMHLRRPKRVFQPVTFRIIYPLRL
jgi:hypothetical protein